MGLIDDDGEPSAALLVADLVEDEGEFLHRRDDDLPARFDKAAQVARTIGVAHRRPDLGILLDRVVDLPVEDAPVGDHDDGVEDGSAVLLEPDQLVRQPGYGVALAAAGRVLDQVAPARAMLTGVFQQPAHHVELVVAGPDLGLGPAARLLVPLFHQLCVVLEDVGQALAGQHLTPQIVRLDPARVGGVAGAVVPAPVEGQEPGRLAPEVGAEARLGLVHGEVGNAAAELEQLLARVSVPPVLLDRVVHGLLGQVVLELEGDDRQAVDEERDVQRPLRLVAAVAELPGDGEAVLRKAFPRLLVAGRRRPVEEVHIVRAVPDAVAQDLDGAPLRNLALKPRQELAACRTVLVQRQGRGRLRLGTAQEGGKLGEIDAEFAVVIPVAAAAPAHPAIALGRFGGALRRGIAGMARQRRADEPFQPPFGGVR